MEPMMFSSVFMTNKCAQELGTHLVCGCAVFYHIVHLNTVCTTVCVKMLFV